MSVTYTCLSCNSNDTSQFLDSKDVSAFFCNLCFLVSVNSTNKGNVIDSPSSVGYMQDYTDEAISRLHLDHNSYVVELASGDGSQLQFFKKKNIPCVGYESSPGLAAVSREKKIDTIEELFGIEEAWKFLAESHSQSHGRKADLVIVHNVLPHVDDINDLLEGISLILKESGTATCESPSAKRLLDENQSDEVYSVDACYFSTHAFASACARHDLEITDVEYCETLQGGVVRWSIQHKGLHMVSPNVTEFLGEEIADGLTSVKRFIEFGENISKRK